MTDSVLSLGDDLKKMEESYNHAQHQWMDNMINACQVGCHSVEARRCWVVLII